MRPKHYVSAGSQGIAFDCWHAELRRHLDSASSQSYPRTYSVPIPLRTTNVLLVTCHHCLNRLLIEIRAKLPRS